MLKKKYRLPIQSVIGKNGRVVKTPFFLVKIFPGTRSHGRVGVVMSKKVAAKATERNALRRIIFSAAEPFLDELKGKDVLLITNSSVKKISRDELRSHLQELFVRIK